MEITIKKIEKEIAAAKAAIENLPAEHRLAPFDYRCGGRRAGQSYNAMFAEERGELTKSKLPAVLRRMLECGYASSTMWHHTGQFKGHMNETLFFAGCDFDLEGYENYLNNKEAIDSQRNAAAIAKAEAQALRLKLEGDANAMREAWLQANCNYVTRVTRRLFVEKAQEMNPKYGWFDSKYKSYNLTQYYTGWELKEGVNTDEYYAIGQQLIAA
jgi:hypothetical protein